MLPREGTKEWQEEIAFYIHADQKGLEERAQQLGIKKLSYAREMHARGVYRGEKRKETQYAKTPPLKKERPSLIINTPKIHLHSPPNQTSSGEEQMMILHVGDGHAGKLTKSFNNDVYRKRMETIYKSTMIIVKEQRNVYPIRKLRILNSGDNVQGENPYQGSKIDSVTMGAGEQVTKLALPTWLDLIYSLKQEFEDIEIDAIRGNHGNPSKEAAEKTNWDLILYDGIKSVVEREKGIKFNIHEEEMATGYMAGYKFLLFHGGDIKCQQGVPLVAIKQRLIAWQGKYHFRYAFGGHFHKRLNDELSSQSEFFMVSTLVSDDGWAESKGLTSIPSQWLLGLHPKYGISSRWVLYVDDDYLPSVVREEEI